MFFGKKERSEKPHKTYDRENQKPVIRCSICTGEQVAGFRRLVDGSFEEVMLLRTPGDLQAFRDSYGISEEIEKFY